MTRKVCHFTAVRSVWALLCAFFISAPAFGLNEVLETYNALQGLAMGNAFTADASGANALFYNPAGLSRGEPKWSITPVAIDGAFSGGYLSTLSAARNMWLDRMVPHLNSTAGKYNYFRLNALSTFTRRNFGIALIGTHEWAGLSDGTQVDLNYRRDFGVVVGGSTNLFSNMVKLGISVKFLDRNEMAGVFDPSTLDSENPTAPQMKEGLGIGADLGAVFTLPATYLPTFAFVWKDALIGTNFIPMRLTNSVSAAGAPNTIAQSFNLGASMHPVLWKGARGTFTAEIRHLERTDLSLGKKLHFGFQFVHNKKLFFWAGWGQMCPSGGVGLRLRGGDFELATYGVDIGDPTTVTGDRRFGFRWTIGL